MGVILRNRVSTEYREVEAGSAEFFALTRELHADNRPRWEQTGEHDAAAFAERHADGTLRETDIGDAGQPSVVDTLGDVTTKPQLDRGFPTPGEIEQEAGRAANLDEDELRRLQATAGVTDKGTGYPTGTPASLSDEDAEELTQENRIERGVADDPVDTPSVPATTGGVASSDGSTNYARKGVQDLKDEAESRGLTVVRSDGSEGDPLKADYVSALEKDDEENS